MKLTLGENSKETFQLNNKIYNFYSLSKATKNIGDIKYLPKSMKILLENLLRWQDDIFVTEKHIHSLINWQKNAHSDCEIFYHPTRVLMQDFTGVPAVIDLAVMRETVKRLGGNATKVNPLIPVDLIIDHSVAVDYFANENSFEKNVKLEMERNYERYSFLKWGQTNFDKFRVVPPGTGICHQVNLEYLGKSIWHENINGKDYAWPDSLIGTDSHTTMINALGILGWGVGGIEAEAAMLGQPISMLIPDVVGINLTGKLQHGISSTDLVLTITNMIREYGVVGKFIEFYGDGLSNVSLYDRATIANMAPEYGATCSFFPIDQITLDYLKLTGRDLEHIKLIEIYTKKQGMWRNSGDTPIFSKILSLDMNKVKLSIAGPKRPQDLVFLYDVPKIFTDKCVSKIENNQKKYKSIDFIDSNTGLKHTICDGSVVISAITSCTNTSNPNALITAGLLAKKAIEHGLTIKPWVKTSFAPGSRVVSIYLKASNLTYFLDKIGFNLVGYGCTTCIGNSGPISKEITSAITKGKLIVNAVLSGNRNFEGRIHPLVKANWLASPALVIAYALAGTMTINFQSDPINYINGKPIYLKDLWPSSEEILHLTNKITKDMFTSEYRKVFNGTKDWQNINVNKSITYNWDENSTYIRPSPFFDGMKKNKNQIEDIQDARILAILGDSITTDHISPAGNIADTSPAGCYLLDNGIDRNNFNSYGSRRGNHEVMIRGTFANIHLQNEMLYGIKGGYTKYYPNNITLSIYDAAMKYQKKNIPLIIIAGKEYGSGSSRDWAAKGPRLQGVRVIIAESFERIHRSNLIGMGILPLVFLKNTTRKTLKLTGEEIININNIKNIYPNCIVPINIKRSSNKLEILNTQCRIDTYNELIYYKNGGILHHVIRNLLN